MICKLIITVQPQCLISYVGLYSWAKCDVNLKIEYYSAAPMFDNLGRFGQLG